MMKISGKQCAIINSVIKPFKITSKYLSPRLHTILVYYCKYFHRRRHVIVHTTQKSKNSYCLTLRFNYYTQRGGYAKRRRPRAWNFHGVSVQTKYGRKLQRRTQRRKRKKKKVQTRKQKNKAKKDLTDAQSDETQQSAKFDAVVDQNESNGDTVPAEPQTTENAAITTNLSPMHTSSEEPSNKIFDLDLNAVSELIVESDITDSNCSYKTADSNIDSNKPNRIDSPAEERNSLLQYDDASKLTALSKESEEAESSIAHSELSLSQENDSTAAVDINEKLRQQLKLLKMGKNESTTFAVKPVKEAPCTRSKISLIRRSTSEELKASVSSAGQGSKKESGKTPDNGNETQSSTKSIGGRIDSLFTKMQSINSKPLSERPPSARLAARRAHSPPKMTSTPTQPKHSKHNKLDDLSLDSNTAVAIDDTQLEDSNQSSSSMPTDFFGFDMSNKNVDVSALLPTPKVSTSNRQSAFVSEDLDMFMKENSLECAKLDVTLPPRACIYDEALMTVDAAPPNLAVPERPLDMQRPRTLAEKRMILQQQNDFGILIIENESTVYHELKKRVRLGSDYDNTLMQNIQEAVVPFTRDCWKAASWLATANNRFFYRTINVDGEEIKLIGSRGNNAKKLAFELTDQKMYNAATSKYLKQQCKNKCMQISGIKINNIDAVMADVKVKQEKIYFEPKRDPDLLLRKPKLNMFSQNYMQPAPKCKKTKCKANRSSSFDLEYGPLEVLTLPTVQLEMWPQIGISLPDNIKPILKTLLPETNVVTPEWAKFAVSVVQQSAKPVKHRRKYIKPDPPQPFVFDIPFENDEKKILIRRRRRSTIIFNKSDAKYEDIESFYQSNDQNVLEFRKDVDQNDVISTECADVLSSMIESVAVAVNEPNFTKLDPDIDYVGKVVSVASLAAETTNKTAVKKLGKEKTNAKTGSSKTKLMKELKRLNVTVIDTANETKKVKKEKEACHKKFCKLGCVCESIDTPKFLQTHCRLTKCMFGCVCTNTLFKQTHPFNLSEDIDLLQAQAQARLAKVEKEFKATIIVSENDMFVLPNTHTSSKRSSKKPKRFTNDECSLDEIAAEMPSRTKRRRFNEKPIEVIQQIQPIEQSPVQDEFRSKVLNSIQHVLVELDKLPEMGVEAWCMIHCLYKCHCKGRSQKGRAFSFSKNKNNMHTGWEVVTPRKRQYTFERDQIANNEEPSIKERKVDITPPHFDDLSEVSARTSIRNWQYIPRKTAFELKMLRNKCLFAENPFSDQLKERIKQCRNYNKSQNILMKSLANERALAGNQAEAVTPSPAAIQRLNDTISDTMKRIISSQNQNKLVLNTSQNKLTIIAWDRILQAFKSREIFIWEVCLTDSNKSLLLTENFSKPKNQRFVQVSNIHYADMNTLPLVARLLRQDFRNAKTKYLAVVLLRIHDYWRIVGVVHSDLKYMDDELLAKPTPDKNPVLSRKINTLFHLLVKTEKNPQDKSAGDSVLGVDANSLSLTNDHFLKPPTSVPDEETLTNISSQIAQTNADNFLIENPKTYSTMPKTSTNSSVFLSLPIQVDSSERLLMLNLGDDFTHIWFPNCRKFLSMKKIKTALAATKQSKRPIELNQNSNIPKVFVCHTHDNNIFIGPYKKTDKQNLALFVREDNHMVLADVYHKKTGSKYTKKSKALWIYPNSGKQSNETTAAPETSTTSPLKIGQIYSNYQADTDLDLLPTNNSSPSDSNSGLTFGETFDETISPESPPSNEQSDGAENDMQTVLNNGSSVKVFDLSTAVPVKAPEPLPLLISSVTSGDGVRIITNGTDLASEENADKANASAMETTQADEAETSPENEDHTETPNESKENSGELILTNEVPNLEAIEIYDSSEDENDHFESNEESNVVDNEMAMDARADDAAFKTERGFLFCETNKQLGKMCVEWTSQNHIKLILDPDIEADDSYTGELETNPAIINAAMFAYIRRRFYAVYPTTLILKWSLVKSIIAKQTVLDLSDLNQIDKFSVVLKDKIIHVDSNYRDDIELPAIDKYVVDIFKLASQLFSENIVKTLNISEIMKKAKQIDKEEIQKQDKLVRLKQRYQLLIEKVSKNRGDSDGEKYQNGKT